MYELQLPLINRPSPRIDCQAARKGLPSTGWVLHIGICAEAAAGDWMTTLGGLAFNDLRMGGLFRPAIEKFCGAWLACLLVMARGNIFAAFSVAHIILATVCWTVGALATLALLVQMDRTIDSVGRQATISAVVTLIGDVFAHPSHFPPQWAEPLVTAAVSAGIAIALWYAKRWAGFTPDRHKSG
jgi:hypothetical protein